MKYVLTTCLLALLTNGCTMPPPPSTCETGDDCAMVPVEDRCSENAQCGCGPNRVPASADVLEEYAEWSAAATCLPSLCLGGVALCRFREEHLFCLDATCGVAFDDDPLPEGAVPTSLDGGR